MYPLTYTVTTDQNRLEFFLTARSEESFCLLCESISPRLMRYFRARSCDHAAAEELTQDVLFTVYRRAYGIREPRLFYAWLFQVARNALLQRLRSSGRRIQTVGQEDAGAEAWSRATAVEPPEMDCKDSLACLESRDREILLLRYIDGLDYKEIAAALDIPVGTAKWRVFNSKIKLAASLRRDESK